MGVRVTDNKTRRKTDSVRKPGKRSRKRAKRVPEQSRAKQARAKPSPAKQSRALREGKAFLIGQRVAVKEKLERYERRVKALREELVSGRISRQTHGKRLRDVLGGRPFREWRAYFAELHNEIDALERELTGPRAALVRS